VVTGWRRD